MSRTLAAASTAPATKTPRATHFSAGAVAPRSAVTSTPGWPSAFMTTTVQDPSVGSQVRLRGPDPVEVAAQKSWSAGTPALGAEDVAPPTRSVCSDQKSVITVCGTPARYRSTSAVGPTPTNKSGSPAAGSTR